MAAGHPWDLAAISKEREVSLGVGREGMGPGEGERLAGPSKGVGELLESLSRGCGQLRYLLGVPRSLEAAVCQ